MTCHFSIDFEVCRLMYRYCKIVEILSMRSLRRLSVSMCMGESPSEVAIIYGGIIVL